MAGKRRLGIERRKGICTERRRIEGRNNPVTSRYASSRTQRTMEDGRVGDKKLLVAGSNERHRKICGRV